MAVDIEAAFVKWVLAQPAITALIGSKFEPFKTNQKINSPYVTYFEVAHDRKRCLTGNSGLSKVIYRLDIIGETEAAVNAIRNAFVDELDDPPMIQGTMDTVDVPYAYIDNQTHVDEMNYGASDVWPFHKALLVAINYYH